MKKITPEQIKRFIERNSTIDDISVKSRKKEIVFLRHVYYQLTWDFCRNYKLREVAEVLNQDHSSTIHGRKMFPQLRNQRTFENALEIYELAVDHFSSQNDNERIYHRLNELSRERNKLINQIQVNEAETVR